MATEEKHWASQARPARAASSEHTRTGYLLAKRLLDITVTGAALFILSPLLLVIAVLIKLDSPGPVIFSQERMGYDQRKRRVVPFRMHKFRSMFHNADQDLHRQRVRDWVRGNISPDPSSGDSLIKLTHDVRVTRVGRVLRKTSLDELPQLWNVLVGEMSLVGPRPVPLYEVEEYQPWHRGRLEATPGITCLWQVKGRGLVSVDEMVEMDLEYIDSRTLWLDLKILIQTVPVVLSGRGAI